MAEACEPITLPEPVHRSAAPKRLDLQGWWLILSDVHLPFHDAGVVELAIAEAVRRRACGVLLNGDVIDCHQLSRFEKSPDDPQFRAEVAAARQFLAYLRSRLPKAQVVWKEGNHEERLFSYVVSRGEALHGLDDLEPASLFRMRQHGVEYVGDRRVIKLGKLNVIHGHEYRPGIQCPVNPARGLFLRSHAVSLCGHFHQTSEHHQPDINGAPMAAWSTGCACHLSPRYMPLNKWNHGFCFVDVGKAGRFHVENLRVLDGEIL